MPFFSIIIPVYNTAQFLDRCMNSLISQTFTDFEILLIDDGSTDSSFEICKKWEKKDKRIRVFHQENKGASSARNIGLKNSRGTYIQLVDSDDELLNNCLETIFSLIQLYKEPDIIEFRLNYIGATGIKNIQGTTLLDGVYNREYLEERFLPVILQVTQNDEMYYGIFNV